ncbi:hypothetical protein JXA02_04265 [candidate division KSB1 bacterium]|nr:hypothetical protein [candidate division KSB1 bacterium]RQW08972.1 MAG: hypothetical protein EH222_04805 [candidate division KSB1 bacterium]
MMHRQWRQSLIICFFASFGHLSASTGGVVGIISPRLMYDGRPVLWQNLDSDLSDVQIKFYAGERYNFFGLLNGVDSARVFAGLNTAGFALAFSTAFGADSLDGQEALLVRQALGECGRIQDFARLIESTAIDIEPNASFACIDAFDSYRLYEANGAAFDLKESSDGFLLRANFNFADSQAADAGYWRYHRARQLIAAESAKRKLHHHVLVKKIARDLQSLETDPYPMLSGTAPTGPVRSENCINQYNTVSCIVIHGVRPGENPDFATMWVVLGEPLCGVAVPLWPATSQVPFECQLLRRTLNAIFVQNKRSIYDRYDVRQFDATACLALQRKLNDVENQVFVDTRKALARWRQSDDHLQDMINFQMMTTSQVYRALKE